jgi:hypothetical protein
MIHVKTRSVNLSSVSCLCVTEHKVNSYINFMFPDMCKGGAVESHLI